MRLPLGVRILGAWILVFGGSRAIAWACSCAPLPPTDELVGSAEQVFVGDVVSIGGCGRERAVRFEVTEAFKGVEVGDTVTLTTAADGAGCGVDFAAADAWLVVSQDGDSANLCSGTAPSADAGTLLEEIRALP